MILTLTKTETTRKVKTGKSIFTAALCIYKAALISLGMLLFEFYLYDFNIDEFLTF